MWKDKLCTVDMGYFNGVSCNQEDGIDNIKFSAYFLRDLDGDGYAEKLKGTCSKINTSDRAELNKRLLCLCKFTWHIHFLS